MDKKDNTRRDFIRKSFSVSAGIAVGGILPGFASQSYKRIIGSNERLRASVMGVNSRGLALCRDFSAQKDCEVVHVCDVDSRAIDKAKQKVFETARYKPEGFGDFRKSLEDKDVDVLVVATPDHWHAPATLMGMEYGKHVYVEKPLSHNPKEGEILVEAQKKYGKVIQMGSQRRSLSNVVEAINSIRSGIIGRVYYGRGWYANNRAPIGIGKKVAVPGWLDWNLWQGPAPRQGFKDNFVHYNWHWFWDWGTGEALNNGTHMVDLLRWGLGVDYPVRVSSNGGRYRYQDDWQTPDTQVVSADFKGGVSLSWEGRSCNGTPVEGTSVGAMFYGEEGSLLIKSGNAYTVYDLKGKVIKVVEDSKKVEALDLTGGITGRHIRDFINAIKTGVKPVSDVLTGHKSTLIVQLGNIAQRVGRSLDIDHQNGHILHDKEANKLWSREYEKGWEMKL